MRARLGIAGLLLVSLFGCQEPSVTTAPDETDTGAAQTPAAAAAKASVGDPITLVGTDENLKVRVTVLKVADPATAKSTDFSALEEGNRFVGVQLSLENVGTLAYDDSPGNGAKLVDAGGQQYDEEIAEEIAEGPLLGSAVTIGPGDNRTGWMVFQLGQTAQLRTFQMALDSGFAGQHGEWSLGEG